MTQGVQEINGYYSGYIGTRPYVTEQGLRIVRIALMALTGTALAVGIATFCLLGNLPVTAIIASIAITSFTLFALSYIAQGKLRGSLTTEEKKALIETCGMADCLRPQLENLSGSRYYKIIASYAFQMAAVFTRQEGMFKSYLDLILNLPKKSCYLIPYLRADASNEWHTYVYGEEQKPWVEKENPLHVIHQPKAFLTYEMIKDIENPILGF